MQRTKKKASVKKNLLPNISTVGALEKIMETDLGSYSAGLSFSLFFTILDNKLCVGNSKGIPMGITMSTPTLTLEGNTLQTHG